MSANGELEQEASNLALWWLIAGGETQGMVHGMFESQLRQVVWLHEARKFTLSDDYQYGWAG